MDHEQAAQILPDYAEGVIDSGDADAVERHLASCEDCRESLSLLRRIATEIATMGAAAFDDHPDAVQLVDYSLVRGHLADADLAKVKRHVKSCPTCAHEVAAVRSAESASQSPWRGIMGALGSGIAPSPIPALATAFVALLLVYPSYLGLVRLPVVARERNEAIDALASRQTPDVTVAAPNDAGAPRGAAPGGTMPEPRDAGAPVDRTPTDAGDTPRVAARTWNGGPIATLALAAPTRGTSQPGSESGTPIPIVHLRPRQAFLPVRIDFDLSMWAAEQVVVLTLHEFNSPRQLWRHSGSAAEIWDPSDEAINLLLPAESLGAGTYVLEIAREGSSAAEYSARFAIED